MTSVTFLQYFPTFRLCRFAIARKSTRLQTGASTSRDAQLSRDPGPEWRRKR
ncbi:hypothetical protein Slin14017_G125150 [Septoria linicola]|nr:hypothetical protein Slin14017_G125150 [Septoria linicola]